MQVEMLTGAGVWKRDDLVSRTEWQGRFEEANPLQIREELESGPGALMLSGFPIAQYDLDGARTAFMDWCSQLGTLLSQNEKGEKAFDVANAGFADTDPRMRGPNTNKKLSFHTDRCDVIAFLCWRKAKRGGENELVSSMHLFNEIGKRRPDLLEILMQPFVYKRHAVDLGNELPYCEQPIFSFRDGFFACSFLRVLIDRAHADPELSDLSPTQIEALDYLEEVANEADQSIRLTQEPGDILLLNNWTTLHRRTAFKDHGNPEDRRRLFRIWLSMPNSRPIDPRFEANFGATGAGELRGGFRTVG